MKILFEIGREVWYDGRRRFGRRSIRRGKLTEFLPPCFCCKYANVEDEIGIAIGAVTVLCERKHRFVYLWNDDPVYRDRYLDYNIGFTKFAKIPCGLHQFNKELAAEFIKSLILKHKSELEIKHHFERGEIIEKMDVNYLTGFSLVK